MSGACVIGVDLGGTKLLAGAVDERLAVHHRARRSARGEDQAEVIETIVAAIQEARESVDAEVRAVGIGVPSLIDSRRGVVAHTVHLPLADLQLSAVLGERLGLPVFVDNDANVALLAEHRFGAARGAANACLLTLGTGIGGAILIDGRIRRGADGAAGELGHMVIETDGPPCGPGCPSNGCLESLASGTAVAREGLRVAQAAPESALGRALAAGREVNGPLVTELAHDGDRAARDVLALIGTRLGVGISNLVNIFNPEVVVVGGGVIAAGELVLAPARDVVARRALPFSRERVRIEPARFADEAGMLGAAVLAHESTSGRAAA